MDKRGQKKKNRSALWPGKERPKRGREEKDGENLIAENIEKKRKWRGKGPAWKSCK